MKPQYVLFAVTALLVIISLFSRRQTLEIHTHDSYYIIKQPVFIIPAALAVIGLLYVICGQWLASSLLTWLHVAGTVLAVLSVTVISISQKAAMPRNYAGWSSFDRFAAYNSWLTVMVFILIFAQLAFVLNFILSAIKIMQK